MKKIIFTLLSATLLVFLTFSEGNAQKKKFLGQVPPVRTNQNGVIVNSTNATNRQGRWNTTRTRSTNDRVWRNEDDDRNENGRNKKKYKSNNGKHKGWYKNNNGNGHRPH